MTETIAERLVREKTQETAGFADYLARNADATASEDTLTVKPREARMTQRFEPIVDIFTPAPEPTKTEKVAAVAAAFTKRNASVLTFAAGVLTGSLLTIVSGLIR
jgi:hypothetical protein